VKLDGQCMDRLVGGTDELVGSARRHEANLIPGQQPVQVAEVGAEDGQDAPAARCWVISSWAVYRGRAERAGWQRPRLPAGVRRGRAKVEPNQLAVRPVAPHPGRFGNAF